MSKRPAIAEQAQLLVEGKPSADGKTLPVQFISAGWGSSGYYSQEVLQEAATNRVIPKGTHMYADHPTKTSNREQPGRSIKDLIGVTLEDARVSKTTGALIGEVEIVPQWRGTLQTIREAIGVSILGDATDITEGEAEGRKGNIVAGIASVASVDFVTKAGRGGKVLQVLESAQTHLEHDLDEGTYQDLRTALQAEVTDTYGGDKSYAWVRDFDDSTVWFTAQADGMGEGAIWAQTYTNTDGAVALTGTKTEVRVKTSYVPVKENSTTPDVPTKDPVGRTTTTQEDKMGTIQIEEAEATRLRDDAGRVPVLEAERDTARTERDQARAVIAAYGIIAEADEVTFSPLEVTGLLAGIVLLENGQLDAEAFGKVVTEQVDATKKRAAKLAETAGAGTVSGFGAPTSSTSDKGIAEDEYLARLGIPKIGA